jgi:hypothetical protein
MAGSARSRKWRFFSSSHLERRGVELTLLVAVALFLELAAGTGLAYLAGFSRVRAALLAFHWPWLLPILGALIVSFVGYYYAYRGIFHVDKGPTLARRYMRAVVAAGFGGFLAHGGGALDQYALEAAGANKDEAKVRVSGLAGLEHGVLAIGGTVTAVTILVAGSNAPPADFTIPWAVLPVPGFLIGFWAAGRYCDRLSGQEGWRKRLWTFLDSVRIIKELFVKPLPWGTAVLGMAVFWAADALAAWSAMAVFGLRMNAAQMFVGFATGMVFTRRTGPLAGAGVLALVLPLTMWVSGAPFAVAIVGIFLYRVLAFLLPLPVSFAALPTLRRMGHERLPTAEGVTDSKGEPGLRRAS